MLRRRRADLLILALLFVLPLLLFWSVTLGGKTLLPVDNLFQWQPWKAAADQFNAQIPQNQLVSDLILENYAWKHFIVESIPASADSAVESQSVCGCAVLGERAALRILSVLAFSSTFAAHANAYGWFTVSQLFLAGAFMYVFCRVLGIGRLGSLTAAIIYQLSGFYIVSVVFTMIIAAAAWLPLLLALIELIIQQRSIFGRPATLPWMLIGAMALACQIMAGHIEITYYTLLIMALYALWRLIDATTDDRRTDDSRRAGQSAARHVSRLACNVARRPVVALIVMVVLGVGLAAIQIAAAASRFCRRTSAWDRPRSSRCAAGRYPPRHVLEMLMPNFFGNPAEHTVFDIIHRAERAAQ